MNMNYSIACLDDLTIPIKLQYSNKYTLQYSINILYSNNQYLFEMVINSL